MDPHHDGSEQQQEQLQQRKIPNEISPIVLTSSLKVPSPRLQNSETEVVPVLQGSSSDRPITPKRTLQRETRLGKAGTIHTTSTSISTTTTNDSNSSPNKAGLSGISGDFKTSVFATNLLSNIGYVTPPISPRNSGGDSANETTEKSPQKKISKKEKDFYSRYKHEITLNFEKWNTKRDKIAYEFLTTETTYVKSLEITIMVFRNLIDEYIGTLPEDARSKLTPQLVPLTTLFVQIEMIWEVNFTLLEGLKEKFLEWDDKQMIGDVVFMFAPFLKMYQAYAQVYDEGRAAFKKALERDKNLFQTHEKGVAHPLVKCNSLESFLILPVQRIPRYVLLLTDLLKNTSEDHPDAIWLSKSLEIMKEVANNINNAVIEAERRRKCFELFKQFDFIKKPIEAQSYYLYIHSGTVLKQCHNKRDPIELFLLSDIILYGRITSLNRYEISGAMPLETALIEEIPDKVSEDILNAFILKSPHKSFICYASDHSEKQKWVNMISEAITESKHKNNARKRATCLDGGEGGGGIGEGRGEKIAQAAVWKPDDSQNCCSLCRREFTPIRRRHHCRKCGALVDNECSKYSMLIPELSEAPVRVCYMCHRLNSGNKNPALLPIK